MIQALKLIGVAAVSSLVFTITNTIKATAQTTPEQSSQNRQVDRKYSLSFEYRGCQRAKNNVVCDIVVTNFANTHQKVSLGARYKDYQTRATDTQGNVYISEGLQLNSYQKGQERVLIELPPGIPTKLAFGFRIPPQVTELAAIDLGYMTVSRVDTIGRITISNIGGILTQSNPVKS